MKKTAIRKGFLGLLLAVLLVLSAVPVFAGEEDSIDLNKIDAVFVIDGSGSMRHSDPDLLAPVASQLVMETLGFDGGRAGYVIFTTEIEAQQKLTELRNMADRDALRQKFADISYTSGGDTDISLGLTAAMNLLIQDGAVNDSRSPMIVFLSDGKTDNISTLRQQNYAQELAETKRFLGNNGIPVYTIGLGSSVDEKTLTDIAEETGGLYFHADAANQLNKISFDIIQHQLGADVKEVIHFTGDGQPHDVVFNIPNDRVYQAQIVIMTTVGVTDIHLKMPNGNEVVVPSDNVLMSTTNAYQLLKVMRPMKGDWTLTLTGADGDDISIKLINSFDNKTFDIRTNRNQLTNGDSATISVYCSNESDDTSVFDGAEGILTIRCVETGTEETADLIWKDTEMSAGVTFDKAGTYMVRGHVTGKDSAFNLDTKEIKITVAPYPLTVIGDSAEQTLKLNSPFLFVKFNSKKELSLKDIVAADPDALLTVSAVPGGWESTAEVEYDAEDGVLEFTALKSGKASVELKITDNFGQSADYTVDLSIFPTWVYFAGVLLLLIIAALVIILVSLNNRPVVNGRITLSLTLPDQIADQTPQEAEFDLSGNRKKGKITFFDLIAGNMTVSGQYRQVLSGINDMLAGLTFEAVKGDDNTLIINISVKPNYGIAYNGMRIERPTAQIITGGSTAILQIESVNGPYSISFTLQGRGGFGGVGFETGQGGFGNSFGSGQSGFGGGNQDGFGGFGGGNQDGFGGFGGGQGGFNGGNQGGPGGFGGGQGGYNGGNQGGFGGFNGNGPSNDGFGSY